MKTKQKSGLPQTLTLTELAGVLGLTTHRLNQLEREGVIKKLGRGVYPLSAIRDYAEHMRRVVQGNGAGAGLLAERASLARERALRARLDREVLQGKWAPADQIESAWATAIKTMAMRLLAMPQKCATLVLGLTSPGEIEAALRKEVTAAMRELSEVEYRLDDGKKSKAA
jgi:phage terminase Nu1 subunit (DNA packaging protein)